jgi:hypothetical protein
MKLRLSRRGLHSVTASPRARLNSAQDPYAAPPAAMRGKGRSAWATHLDLSRVGLGTDQAQLVEAHDPSLRDWLRVGVDDRPLFSIKEAFTVTWNQLCWGFRPNPSAWSHCQIADGVTPSPWRS